MKAREEHDQRQPRAKNRPPNQCQSQTKSAGDRCRHFSSRVRTYTMPGPNGLSMSMLSVGDVKWQRATSMRNARLSSTQLSSSLSLQYPSSFFRSRNVPVPSRASRMRPSLHFAHELAMNRGAPFILCNPNLHPASSVHDSC